MTGLSFAQADEMRRLVDSGAMPTIDDYTTEQLQKLTEYLWEKHVRSPLFQRYFAHNHLAHNGSVNREPWTAIGERLLVSHFLLGPTGWTPLDQGTVLGGSSASAMPSSFWVGMSISLEMFAVPYLLLNDPHTAIRAAPVPAHVVSRDVLPYPFMFFSYETRWESKDGTANNWCAVLDKGSGMDVYFDQSWDGGKMLIHGGHIPYGKRFPDDYADPGSRRWARFLLALFAFLNSPYTDRATHRLPRFIRRDLQRAGYLKKEDVEPVAHTVILRRISEKNGADDGTPEGRTYHHQWWVSGHIRSQFYPSLQAHKLIWIGPHLKGPTDKPILEKTYVVAR